MTADSARQCEGIGIIWRKWRRHQPGSLNGMAWQRRETSIMWRNGHHHLGIGNG